jgi:hypothetical protein
MRQIAKAALGAIIFYLGAAASASAMVGATSAQAIANPNESSGRNFLDVVSGASFKTASGYALKLSQSEDGMALAIAGTDGATKRMLFSFYDDRTGNVSDEDGSTVGRFWITPREIYIRYRDGWSEAMWSSSTGDLQMAQKAPDGRIRYTIWYSRDHLPSSNALATLPTVNKPNAIAPVTSATTHQTQSVAPVQAIEIRTSVIHTIDQPVAENPVVAGGTAVAAAQSFSLPPQQSDGQSLPNADPSKCLSIESNGAHWGFRNRCAFDIQFAYCVASNSDQLTSCKAGAVTGSVAPHGFGALTADRSIGDSSADHDFRWIACGGGAGEVVPRMDHSDPPTGRCLRSNAS